MSLRATQSVRSTSGSTRRAVRRAPLRVVAFKGHDATRAELLTTLAHEYAHAWIKGVKQGRGAAEPDFSKMVDNEVELYSAHSPFSAVQNKGFSAFIAKVERDRARGMQPSKVLFAVANEVEDVAYLLVENRPRSAGVCPAQADLDDANALPRWAGRSLDEWDHTAHSCPLVTHSIVKLDVLLDDSACRVTRVREVCQPAYDTGPGFPLERVVPYTEAAPQDSDRNHSIAERWCASLSTLGPQGGNYTLLDSTTDPPSFKFYDAYGHIDRYARSSHTQEGHSLDWLKTRNSTVAKDYRITCRLVDNVASPTHTVGFVHWRAEFTPLAADPKKKPFVVNCVQAETYKSTGKEVKLTSVWAFRDLMLTELDGN